MGRGIFFRAKDYIGNSKKDGAIGDIEDRIGVFVEDEVDHIDHMAIEKIVDDISKGPCRDSEEGQTEMFGRFKEEQIPKDPPDDNDAENQQRNLEIGKKPPSSACIGHVDDGNFEQRRIENTDPAKGKSQVGLNERQMMDNPILREVIEDQDA